MTAPVSLYFWHLTDAAEAACLSPLLSPEEGARADRFVKPADGIAYRIGRGHLRQVLAQWVGGDAASLAFRLGPSGKPALERGPQFNLSHSGGLACLAVHPDAVLGVDIEAPRPVEEGVARRFFSASEYAGLSALPQAEWLPAFFRIWTRKEAVLKAVGTGLTDRLDGFDVTLGADAAVTRMDTGHTRHWSLRHLSVGPRWVGALAVPDPDVPVEVAVRAAPGDVCVTL